MLDDQRRAFEAARDEFLAYLEERTWSKPEPMGCLMIAIIASDGTETWDGFHIHEEQWPSGRSYDNRARQKLVPMIREGMELGILLAHYPWRLHEGEANIKDGGIRATDPEDSEQVWVAFSGLDPVEENVPLARRFGEMYLRHLDGRT